MDKTVENCKLLGHPQILIYNVSRLMPKSRATWAFLSLFQLDATRSKSMRLRIALIWLFSKK